MRWIHRVQGCRRTNKYTSMTSVPAFNVSRYDEVLFLSDVFWPPGDRRRDRFVVVILIKVERFETLEGEPINFMVILDHVFLFFLGCSRV